VLIPIQPSPLDLWAAAQTLELVREAQQFRESIRAVLSRIAAAGPQL
jgi:chromosome partitioning protein